MAKIKIRKRTSDDLAPLVHRGVPGSVTPPVDAAVRMETDQQVVGRRLVTRNRLRQTTHVSQESGICKIETSF